VLAVNDNDRPIWEALHLTRGEWDGLTEEERWALIFDGAYQPGLSTGEPTHDD
jgi:hypothetical protein